MLSFRCRFNKSTVQQLNTLANKAFFVYTIFTTINVTGSQKNLAKRRISSSHYDDTLIQHEML
jgi:hypothetical protein